MKKAPARLPATVRKLRCAVYTRKSSSEGLDMNFSSIDNQRSECERYIDDRRNQGWLLIGGRYDDGGYSGGTLERPALKRLLHEIEQGEVDIVVTYKIDRLSRSQYEFLHLLELFEVHDVRFVSITQPIDTTSAAGRAMLGLLTVFAQLEREMAGERIRDKIAASRKRGIWMGGSVPLGYTPKDRKLVIVDEEAATVRMIFERFVKVGSATKLAQQLVAESVTAKSGRRVDKGFLYKLLNNQVYIGKAMHKGIAYAGEHEPIISQDLWDKVHAILKTSPRARAAKNRAQTPALLKGLIFGPDGAAMSPSHTNRRGKKYSYYVSQTLLKFGAGTCAIGRVPAAEIETAVIDRLRILLRSPELVVSTSRAARRQMPGITEADVREALEHFTPLWDGLFPAEQARIVQLLVERVDVDPEGLNIRLRAHGLSALVQELQSSTPNGRAA